LYDADGDPCDEPVFSVDHRIKIVFNAII
jgi:hypothetical protein